MENNAALIEIERILNGDHSAAVLPTQKVTTGAVTVGREAGGTKSGMC